MTALLFGYLIAMWTADHLADAIMFGAGFALGDVLVLAVLRALFRVLKFRWPL